MRPRTRTGRCSTRARRLECRADRETTAPRAAAAGRQAPGGWTVPRSRGASQPRQCCPSSPAGAAPGRRWETAATTKTRGRTRRSPARKSNAGSYWSGCGGCRRSPRAIEWPCAWVSTLRQCGRRFKGARQRRALTPGADSSPSSRGHQPLELVDGIRLDLAHALGGNSIFIRQFVQGGLVVGHPAPLQYAAAALIEFLEGDAEAFGRVLFPLFVLDLDGGVGVARRQVHGRGVGFFLVALRRRVEGHVACRQALLHFANVGHIDP